MCGLSVSIDPLHGITLSESYKKALGYRSEITEAKLSEKAAQFKLSLARGSFLPTLIAVSETEWRDQPESNPQRERSTYLNLTQPLFKGGSEYKAITRSKQQVVQARDTTTLQEWLIFEVVADSFYKIIEIENDLENLETQKKLLEKRVLALERRTSIGESKASDVKVVHGQKARILAELSHRRFELDTERADFSFITGVSTTTILTDETNPDKSIYNPETWSHPEVKLQETALEIVDTDLSIAKSGYLPSLNLASNYYFERGTGFFSKSKWDVSVNLTWQLFSGLSTRHAVSLKAVEKDVARSKLENLKNYYSNHFESLKREVNGRRNAVKELVRAVKLIEDAYEEQKREYEQGLISNLDLLRAMDDLLQTKRSYQRERVAFARAFVRLKHLGGENG